MFRQVLIVFAVLSLEMKSFDQLFIHGELELRDSLDMQSLTRCNSFIAIILLDFILSSTDYCVGW